MPTIRRPRMSAAMTVTVVVLVGLFGVLAVAVGSGRWQVRPILSGSMRPGFPVGGVVVTEREPLSQLQVNDVIVTHPPGEPHFDLIHRIIQIKSRTAGSVVVQTKGDNNPAPDPFTIRVHGPWMYRAHFTVPVVGYAALALHSPTGRRSLLGLAALLFFVALGRMALANRRGKHSASSAGDTSATPAETDELADLDRLFYDSDAPREGVAALTAADAFSRQPGLPGQIQGE